MKGNGLVIVCLVAAVAVITIITVAITFSEYTTNERKQEQYNACLETDASASECALVRKTS